MQCVKRCAASFLAFLTHMIDLPHCDDPCCFHDCYASDDGARCPCSSPSAALPSSPPSCQRTWKSITLTNLEAVTTVMTPDAMPMQLIKRCAAFFPAFLEHMNDLHLHLMGDGGLAACRLGLDVSVQEVRGSGDCSRGVSWYSTCGLGLGVCVQEVRSRARWDLGMADSSIDVGAHGNACCNVDPCKPPGSCCPHL